MQEPDFITVLGPTATGKTKFAAHLALRLNAEIISADSRQIYRKMDIGTGKDYEDYMVEEHLIPCHLIDIKEPGYHYNLYEFQKDFLQAFHEIKGRGKSVILCGGTGMYIDSVLKGYRILKVPVNEELRSSLKGKSMEELTSKLESYKRLHNVSDTSSRPRLVRAIEIADYQSSFSANANTFPEFKSLILGVRVDREIRRERITKRLKVRLESGMIEEVQSLLDNGLQPQELIFYGLEYKYITLYLTGELSYEEMFLQLKTAIHQFAKRQMTWFRKMERQGTLIRWIDGCLPVNDMVDQALGLFQKFPE
jgi:tRNA dimethylallyltransferase